MFVTISPFNQRSLERFVKSPILFITLFIAVLFLTNNSSAQNNDLSMIPENSTILFLGDSITQAGVRPNGYVTLFKNHLTENYPNKNINVIGAGISGNRVPNLQKRLDKDVLSKKPDLVFIYIGINDVWHSQSGRGTSPADFESGLKEIIGKIKSQGGKVILCTPSMIGEKTDGTNPLDKMLEDFTAISRRVAKETDSQLLDLRKNFVEHLKKNNPKNLTKNILTSDGVHLNPIGNQFVATQMLDGLKKHVAHHRGTSVVRHIVLFQFKDSVSKIEVDAISDAFNQLQEKIDVITSLESGTNVSPENLTQGYTHAFIVSFANENDRDIYLPHPAHKAFVKMIDGKLQQVLVFDIKTP
jgi:lysophospholipase L1-like esterase